MSSQPNILVFIPDGMQAAPAAPGHPCVTPNFDRMAERGVTFSRAHTPNPTCSPARASLMTGLLPHNHGVLQVEHCVDEDQCALREDRPHWAQRLADAGYRTGYFGKWHIERSHELDRFGWQVHRSMRSEAYQKEARPYAEAQRSGIDHRVERYQEGPEGYAPKLHYAVTDTPVEGRPVSMPARLAGGFLEEAFEGDAPWCCAVSYPDPNEAMICSRATYDMYDVDSIELPATLGDELEGRPAIYRRSRRIWKDITENQWREALACYWARITEVDGELGKLLARIEESGKLDDTIVIVTTDHGKYVGEHGMEGHNFGAFEALYHIPMMISGPDIAAGARSGARVGLQDLCPTMIELAGAEQIDVPDSRSFAAVLRDPAGAEGDFREGYAEYFGTRFPLMQRVLWDGSWKFAYNGFDYDELYDLENDPGELRNLAGEPEHRERLREMMKKIWRRVRDTGDTTLLESQYYSMRFAAVGPDA